MGIVCGLQGHMGRERERERGVCNAFTPKTNKSWDDHHADDKSFYALVVLEAWACRLPTAGYDELLDYAHKHRSMLAPLRQCNASAHPLWPRESRDIVQNQSSFRENEDPRGLYMYRSVSLEFASPEGDLKTFWGEKTYTHTHTESLTGLLLLLLLFKCFFIHHKILLLLQASGFLKKQTHIPIWFAVASASANQ